MVTRRQGETFSSHWRKPFKHQHRRTPMISMKKTALISALSLPLFSLVGCGGSGSSNPLGSVTVNDTEVAVVAAVAGDYGSSSISVAESSNASDIINGYATTDSSDIQVATHGDYFYRIGRYNQDNITKYSFDNPGVPEWQFSVNDDGGTGANPYSMVFVSDTKAYVLRYGASKMWIVNPSVLASDEANFKIGEIDLSAYDSTDGKPEMNAAVLVDGKLYVTLQAMDTANGYVPGQAWLVVIDTNTDTEITTGKGGNLAGVPLSVKNPYDLDYRDGKLFITGAGRFYPSEYTGGIETVSTSNFSRTLILDDGDEQSHPYGQIVGLEVISANALVFRGYASWGNETLYRLDLTTGQVSATAFAGIEARSIKALALDEKDRLWVGLGYSFGVNDPVIQVINTTSGVTEAELNLLKDPVQIVFGRRN
jgi:hypothetical protein